MHLLAAALFAFGGMAALAMLFGALDLLEGPSFAPILLFVVLQGLIVALAYFLFNPGFPSIEELESRGLVEETHYRAKRAFGIEDYNDEGPHYVVELEDGRVLYLVGQYLYEYEPITDDSEPDLNEPRKFPCTEFVLFRHKQKGHVLDLKCGGQVLELETIFSVKKPFAVLEQLLGHFPKDGETIDFLSHSTLREMIRALSR